MQPPLPKTGAQKISTTEIKDVAKEQRRVSVCSEHV